MDQAPANKKKRSKNNKKKKPQAAGQPSNDSTVIRADPAAATEGARRDSRAARSDSRSDSRPDSRSDARPKTPSNSRPNSRSDSRPESRQNSLQNSQNSNARKRQREDPPEKSKRPRLETLAIETQSTEAAKPAGSKGSGLKNGKRNSSRRSSGFAPPNDVPIGEVQYSEPPFEFLHQVGQGTYGKVYKAVEKRTSREYAMKRLRIDQSRDGFPVTAAREIEILQTCRSPHIVRLCEIVVCKSEIYMALEYIQNDLAGMMRNKDLAITPENAKSLIHQVLKGVRYLHGLKIIHRDIKSSNVLVDQRGRVKLADFGLAKMLKAEPLNVRYTNRVISLWYRPPELLLGAEHYKFEVDIWGIGCILAELHTRQPLFYGKDEVSQVRAICSIMGPLDSQDWPAYKELPWTPLIESLDDDSGAAARFKLDRVLGTSGMSPTCYDLVTQMLAMNPAKRLNSQSALSHAYFREDPAEKWIDLSQTSEWHDWEAKNREKKE